MAVTARLISGLAATVIPLFQDKLPCWFLSGGSDLARGLGYSEHMHVVIII
jgi:hypothetical protein